MLQVRLEVFGHEVKNGRAASGEQNLVAFKQVFGLAGHGQRLHAVHQGGDALAVMRVVAGGQRAFIAFDTGQAQGGAAANQPGQRQGLFVVAATGAVTGNPDLHQHREHRAAGARGTPCFNHLHLIGRVDQKPDLQAGMGLQQGREAVEVGDLEDLVGDDDAAHAMARAKGGLKDVGKTDAPGACSDLPVVEFGRHGGLAVRCDVQSTRLAEVAHPVDVVLQRRVLEDGQRKRQCPLQQVPALPAGVFERYRRQVLGIAFAGGVELHL